MRIKKNLPVTIMLSVIIGWSYTVNAQNVNIPDAIFKAYLVGLPNINTNADSEIQNTEAAAFAGKINVYGANIADLTGIEAFTALTELNCGLNQLTSLDVSACTALTNIYCWNNKLTGLVLPASTALTNLSCGDNQLTSLNVAANTALTFLDCYNNQITSLDVATNTALTRLSCDVNKLTSLDVAANTALTYLSCGDNRITSLNVTVNTALTYLDCYSNLITSLDVAANTVLTELSCSINQLTGLDVTTNKDLTGLFCEDNQLTNLNIKNGNNTNLINFLATGNPGLTCIQVDDAVYMDTDWSGEKDAEVSYSESCILLSIPTAPSKSANSTRIYPNPSAGNFVIQNTAHAVQSIKMYNVLGELVYQSSVAGQQSKEINVSKPSGIYTLVTEYGTGRAVNKIIIKK